MEYWNWIQTSAKPGSEWSDEAHRLQMEETVFHKAGFFFFLNIKQGIYNQ